MTRIATLITLAALLPLTACGPQKPTGADPDPIAVDDYPQIVLAPGLDKGLVRGRPIVEHATDTKPMAVTVPMRSITKLGLRVQYRFTFMDGRGRPLKDNPGGWRYATVAPGTQVFMKANSTEVRTDEGDVKQTNPVDWRLEIRAAN